jgi:hypothetical protein
MPIDNNLITSLESLNQSAYFTQKCDDLNQSSYILGPITARVMGVVVIPFSALADVFSHGSLALLKGGIGLILLPYNCVAMAFFPEHSLPKDLELSSAMVHLMRTIDSLSIGVFLPFLVLLNPTKANQFLQTRLHPTNNLVPLCNDNVHQQTLARLEQENTQLQTVHAERLRLVTEENNRRISELETIKLGESNDEVQRIIQTKISELKGLEKSYQARTDEAEQKRREVEKEALDNLQAHEVVCTKLKNEKDVLQFQLNNLQQKFLAGKPEELNLLQNAQNQINQLKIDNNDFKAKYALLEQNLRDLDSEKESQKKQNDLITAQINTLNDDKNKLIKELDLQKKNLIYIERFS